MVSKRINMERRREGTSEIFFSMKSESSNSTKSSFDLATHLIVISHQNTWLRVYTALFVARNHFEYQLEFVYRKKKYTKN